MTARGMAGRTLRLGRKLSERDMAVLESLYRLRLLTTDHIRRLYFAENSLATRARRARALLRRLHELQLVVRLGRQVGGIQAGSQGYVFGLSGLGQAVLDVPGQFGRRRRTVWQTKPYFQDHMLAVAEVYVGLVETCRLGGADLLSFDAEPACWRRFDGPGGETATLKPDVFVQLGVGEYEISAFIEQDLATESLPTITRKLAVYVAFWRSGQEQQARGVFPRVWWLAPTVARCQAIGRCVQRLPSETHALFAVCLASEAVHLVTQLPAQGGAS